MGKLKDLTNCRFGMLVAIEQTNKRTKYGKVIWKCKCDCGNEAYISSDNLLRKNTRSCGCLRIETSKINGNKTGKASGLKARKGLEKFNIENTNIALLKQNIHKNNTSGFKGVSHHKQTSKWQAEIKINKKSIYLGIFDKLEDAVFARKKAEEIYFQPIIDKFNELHPEL